jgi:hypothetical protein
MDDVSAISEKTQLPEYALAQPNACMRPECDLCTNESFALTKDGLSLCAGCISDQDSIQKRFSNNEDKEDEIDEEYFPAGTRLVITSNANGEETVAPKLGLFGGGKEPQIARRRVRGGSKCNALKKTEAFIRSALSQNWSEEQIAKHTIRFLSLNDDDLPKVICELERVSETEKSPDVEDHLIHVGRNDPAKYEKFQAFRKAPYTEKQSTIRSIVSDISKMKDDLAILESDLLVLEYFTGNSAEKVLRAKVVSLLRDEFNLRSETKKMMLYV